MKKFFFSFFYLLLFKVVIAQKMTAREYIETYKDLAVTEMIRSGVPAAITMAQGMLETENGNSDLVKKSNNHFGIKCKAEWAGQTVYHDDDENGECFRKYDSAIFSYRDHSDFLRTRAHYAFLFSLDPADYKGWAYGLKKAGYATNPRYPEILIKSIEDFGLDELTEKALKQIPDYTVFQLEPVKSKVPIIDRSIKKIDQLIESPRTNSKTYNGLKAVYADSGVSLLAIATDFNIPLSTFLEYNDLITDGLLTKSCWLYLQRKRTEGLQDTYLVKGNESLHEVSQRTAIQLSYLLAYNGLYEDDSIEPGTTLSLKSGVSVKGVERDEEEDAFTDKKNNKNKNDQKGKSISGKLKVHKVRPYESLDSIARKYRVSVPKLKEWNGLKSNRLKIGQQLIISK